MKCERGSSIRQLGTLAADLSSNETKPWFLSLCPHSSARLCQREWVSRVSNSNRKKSESEKMGGGGGDHGHGHGHGDFRNKVWSMSGGPYCRPKHWKRNTAIAMFGVVLICIPIAMKSAELEVLLSLSLSPICFVSSMRFGKEDLISLFMIICWWFIDSLHVFVNWRLYEAYGVLFCLLVLCVPSQCKPCDKWLGFIWIHFFSNGVYYFLRCYCLLLLILDYVASSL